MKDGKHVLIDVIFKVREIYTRLYEREVNIMNMLILKGIIEFIFVCIGIGLLCNIFYVKGRRDMYERAKKRKEENRIYSINFIDAD